MIPHQMVMLALPNLPNLPNLRKVLDLPDLLTAYFPGSWLN